jgi:tetratricopeptide (TPR) repeat protein
MVDEIVDRYVAGEFEGEELERVRNYFLRSEARKEQLRFAVALRERASQAADAGGTGTVAATVVPFEPKSRWLVYLAIAASLIVAASIGYTLYRGFQFQSDLNNGLVALNTAYRQERPVEARLSNLDYAPFSVQRGGTPRVDYVQRDLAGTLLMKAATDTPNAASHRALGQYYLAEREIDKAIDQFNTALAIDPYDAKTHINLGAALLEKGKQETGEPLSRSVENFSRSLEHLNEGLKLDNTLLEGYFNRALVYQYMMLPREAEAAWRDYLQRDPNSQWSEEAKRNLKRLEESNSQKSATIDDALKEFREARVWNRSEPAIASRRISCSVTVKRRRPFETTSPLRVAAQTRRSRSSRNQSSPKPLTNTQQ